MQMPEFEGRSYDAIASKLKILDVEGPKNFSRSSGTRVGLWSPIQVRWLKANWGKGPKTVIIEEFEQVFGFPRTWGAISSKARRMGIGPSFEGSQVRKQAVVIAELPEEIILSFLTKFKKPIVAESLCESIEKKTGDSLSTVELSALVKRLRKSGYDIKKIPSGGKIRYGLVRTADISSGMYYKSLGEIGSNLVLSGDWHVGSPHFSIEAFEQLVEDIIENSVSDLMLCGDLIQSLGVHRLEVPDVDLWTGEQQVEALTDHMCSIPKDVKIHMVVGNHESKLKNKVQVGYDALSHLVSKMNERGFHNVYYYGAVANLTMNDEYTYLMQHGSSMSYAVSYGSQKIFEKLIQRPHIQHTGHIHQFLHLPRPPHHHIFVSPSLQRENAWLMNKGITSMVGWIGLEAYSPERINTRMILPRVH